MTNEIPALYGMLGYTGLRQEPGPAARPHLAARVLNAIIFRRA